jgi:hypothetical protein
MNPVMAFGDVLDAADHLSPDEQAELVAILQRRLALAARQRLVREANEARQEFEGGACTPATPEELLREILTVRLH